MAENQDGQEKKHEPSEKKWNEAAERGELPKSPDLSAGVVLVAGAIALLLSAGHMRTVVEGLWIDMYGAHGPPTMTRSDLVVVAGTVGWAVANALLIPLGVISAAAIAVNLAQTQLKLAPKALVPKFERLNAFTGFKQTYLSAQPVVELVKGLLKLVLLAAVVMVGLGRPSRVLPLLSAASPDDTARVMGELVQRMLFYGLIVIAASAAADYGYRYYKQRQQLMLTDKELRDEHKEREGDPQQKGRRRQRARQIALGSMLAAVRDADVVITNPTHYAVALKYERGVNLAPIVVAKGVDDVALKLRTAARHAGVPRVENRPLARGLHAAVRVGHPIPDEYFGPVARVLAVVFAKRKKR